MVAIGGVLLLGVGVLLRTATVREVSYISIGLGLGVGVVVTLLVYMFCSLSVWQGVDTVMLLEVSLVDGVALTLIWLTGIVYFLCTLYSYGVTGFAYSKSSLLLNVVIFFLFLCFSVKNLLFFYLFFEVILIPMFSLIGAGSRGRKVHANYYFFMYTFVSSILLLLGMGVVYLGVGSLNFEMFFTSLSLDFITQMGVLVLFFVGFAAKIPLLPVHIWLPEAHVEAPTVGSVILAAILLKLGAYGMFRVLFPICEEGVIRWSQVGLVPLILLSVLIPAFIATRQVDLKKVVAYSSVVHMGFALLGLFSMITLGVQGFLFLLISHGLISAGMFFTVGMLYDRFHVRNVLYFGGLVQYMPVFGILYFVFIFSNLSVPGTCNFVGEFMVLYSIYVGFGFLATLVCLGGLFATVLFSLILLVRVLFYQISGLLLCNLVDVTVWEFLVLFPLVFYIFLFGVLPNLLLMFFYV